MQRLTRALMQDQGGAVEGGGTVVESAKFKSPLRVPSAGTSGSSAIKRAKEVRGEGAEGPSGKVSELRATGSPGFAGEPVAGGSGVSHWSPPRVNQ